MDYTKFDFKTAERRLRKGNEQIRRAEWPQTYSLKLFNNDLTKKEEILVYNRLLKGYVGILTDEDRQAKDWVDPGA